MGMAKPMPELWSAPLEAIMVLMPMTSPLRVEQRAAGVAGIDGRVGLDGVFNGRAVLRCGWSGWS